MLEWFNAYAKTGRPGVFLDRDGVLNEHIAGGYVLCRADFRWIPGAVSSLRRLRDSGRDLYIVTNQSCINRGMLDLATFTTIMNELVATLADAGAPCTGWLCCPHRPDERCACRKPGAAMLLRAAEATGVPLRRSVLIGDSSSDVDAAQQVGMSALLVERNSQRALSAAVDGILGGAA